MNRSLLVNPFKDTGGGTATATETIDNVFSMPQDKLGEQIKDSTDQIIDYSDTVGGSGGGNSQNLMDRMVPEDASLAEVLGRSAGNVVLPGSGLVTGEAARFVDTVSGGGISDPVEDAGETVADAPGDVAQDVGEAVDNVSDGVNNAVPDFSGLDGFADRVLIGLALTLVAAAAASSLFSS